MRKLPNDLKGTTLPPPPPIKQILSNQINTNTAIEWLQSEFNKWTEGKFFIPQDFLQEAKRLEKKQIIDAHFEGWSDAYDYLKNENSAPRQAEDYFDETYNQNK